MMLCGIPVAAAATADLAEIVRAAGADELADRLDRALADEVKLLALTVCERAVLLDALDDPSPPTRRNPRRHRVARAAASPREAAGTGRVRSQVRFRGRAALEQEAELGLRGALALVVERHAGKRRRSIERALPAIHALALSGFAPGGKLRVPAECRWLADQLGLVQVERRKIRANMNPPEVVAARRRRVARAPRPAAQTALHYSGVHLRCRFVETARTPGGSERPAKHVGLSAR